MPLDADHNWTREDMVTADDIQALLAEHFELVPHGADRGSAPAEEFDVLSGPGVDPAGRPGASGSSPR